MEEAFDIALRRIEEAEKAGALGLDLSGLGLKVLPREIGRLKQLRRLDISRNELSWFPDELLELKALKELELGENNVRLPEEVSGQSPGIIIQYLLEHARGARPLPEARMVFLGEPGVGKTSLVNCLLGQNYEAETKSTLGLTIQKWEVPFEQSSVKLQVWDFGGQQIYYDLHRVFMTRNTIYVLVIDGRESGSNTKETSLHFWLGQIQVFVGNSPVIVVMNKSDRYPSGPINEREILSKYPQIVGFVRVSAKAGTGIDLLKSLIREALSLLPHVSTLIPSSWSKVMQRLECLDAPFIAYAQFQEICRAEVPDLSDGSTMALALFLHDFGSIVYVPNTLNLGTTIITNRHWLVEGILQILSSNEVFKRNGKLDLGIIKKLLEAPDYKSGQAQSIIVNLMEYFQLAVKLSGGGSEMWLVPSALPVGWPEDFHWKPDFPLRFEYHYQILPWGVFKQFMVRVFNLSHPKDYWRNGILIQHEGNLALIAVSYHEKKIAIEIDGNGDRKNTLTYLRTVIQELHGFYKGLEVEELIPYPDDGRMVLFDYQALRQMEKAGKDFVFSPRLGRPIPIKTLTEGVSLTEGKFDMLLHRPEVSEFLSREDLEVLRNQLIQKGDFKEVLNFLAQRDSQIEPELLDVLNLYLLRAEELRLEIKLNIIEDQEVVLKKSRIRNGILGLLRALEESIPNAFDRVPAALEYISQEDLDLSWFKHLKNRDFETLYSQLADLIRNSDSQKIRENAMFVYQQLF